MNATQACEASAKSMSSGATYASENVGSQGIGLAVAFGGAVDDAHELVPSTTAIANAHVRGIPRTPVFNGSM
jgi:hypothetical protein